MLGRTVGHRSVPSRTRPRGRAFLAVPLLTAAVVLLQQVPAQAEASGPYRLVGAQSSKCMEDPGNSTSNNTIMDIYTCVRPTPNNEQWYFEGTPDGWYNVVNVKSGKCLTVKNAQTTNNAQIIQYTCGTGANEEWVIEPITGFDGAQIRSKNGTNKCVTVQNNGTTNNSKLLQFDCNHRANQAWNVEDPIRGLDGSESLDGGES